VSAAEIPTPGGFTLEAEVTRGDAASWAVVCHPHPAFGGHMDVPLVLQLEDALGAAGWSTVRFNFRGVRGSGGTPTGGHLEQDDVRAVAAWVRAQGAARVALVGYSFGALMSIKAIADGERPSAWAGVGFPTTIVGDDEARIAQVKQALATGTPALFVSGDRDQFCELDRLRGWLDGIPSARLQVETGLTHFPSGPEAEHLCASVARFVSA
jgi:alpha/beta superfamily hydrolase